MILNRRQENEEKKYMVKAIKEEGKEGNRGNNKQTGGDSFREREKNKERIR